MRPCKRWARLRTARSTSNAAPSFRVAGLDSLAATPADYAPDLFVVVTRNTLKSALRVTQRFPTSSLQLFRRTDQFPRSLD